MVADRLDVVAVGIPDEGPVVVVVVLGKDPGRVEDLGPGPHGGFMEGPDFVPADRPKGDVELRSSVR